MLILSAEDVRKTLSMKSAIEAMRNAFLALHNDAVVMPPRAHLDSADREGVTLVMPGLVKGGETALAVKVVSVFPKNVEQGMARIQAAVLVIDPATGMPKAMLEGSSVTAIRTAAVSGLATEQLARNDSRSMAVIGSGVQALSHAEAICCVRSIESLYVYGPTPKNVERLISQVREKPWAPRDVQAASSADVAVAGADIVCTVSTSPNPVFSDASIRPGTHINAVGSYQPHVAEVPPATVARSRVVVDLFEAAMEEAGDLIQPLEAGVIGKDHLREELGAIVAGQIPARESDDQITLFKSVGLAVQDAMAASVCVQLANDRGLGQQVDW